MWDNRSFDDLKKNLNESIFASTQISSKQRQSYNPEYERNLFQISSKFSDEAKTYLKKIKIKRKQVRDDCSQALKDNISARSSLQKIQHDSSICRYQFIKLYHNKKFKLIQGNIVSEAKIDKEYMFRQSVERIRRQKMINEIQIGVRKQKQVRNIQNLQQKRKKDRQILRETLRISNLLFKERSLQSSSKIKKQKAQFSNRKKNMNELATTRSKFNYMSKINDQMQVIKNFQDQLSRINMEDQKVSDANDKEIFTAHFTYNRK